MTTPADDRSQKLTQNRGDFLERYDAYKDEALEFLRSGAVSKDDVDRLAVTNSEAFRWDYVFVDEGQDWPANERDLMVRMYEPRYVAVADGVDQMVRSTAPIDWREGDVPRSMTRIFPLHTCLRMKAGLARFASAMARNLGLLMTEWEASDDVPGGKVIVVDGAYLANRPLHDRLVRENAENGNQPVDMLFCVPPSMVFADSEGTKHSVAATTFDGWGLKTWDGASADVRESYATDVDQFRVVQYESCRGLEGWTVVNLSLDEFYEHKVSTFTSRTADAFAAVSQHDPEAARLHAARWAMIPLTRAMDTIVVQISSPYSAVRSALEAASLECRDYVEWLTLR